MIDVEIGMTPTGQRTFPLGFRIEFLRQWDQCLERGDKVRLLREHGLHRSTIDRWLQARERGEFTRSALAAAERSPHRMDGKQRAELARLRAENQALRAKVAQAEAAQEILGKAFELLDGINKGEISYDQIPPGLISPEEYQAWLERRKLS